LSVLQGGFIMKKRILSLFAAAAIIIGVVPAMTAHAGAWNRVSGILKPGESSTFTLHNVYSRFTDFIVIIPRVISADISVTLTAPNGDSFSNHANAKHIADGAAIKGRPVQLLDVNSPAAPVNNMRVSAILDNNISGVRVTNPVFGFEPWQITITNVSGFVSSFVFGVFQRPDVNIGGELYAWDSTSLDLSAGGISHSDLWQLRAMAFLTQLDLSDNQISDLTSLGGVTDLRLSGLTKLSLLNLNNNQISDLSPLYGIRTMGQVLLIRLQDNPLTLAQILAFHSTLPPMSNVVITHNAVCNGCCESCIECMGICSQQCLHPMCDEVFYCGDCGDCVYACSDCGLIPCGCDVFFTGEQLGGWGGWSFFNGTLTITDDSGMGLVDWGAPVSWRDSSTGAFRITDVEYVVIESRVTEISSSAFAFTNLREIRFETQTPLFVGENAFRLIPPGARAIVPKSWGFDEGTLWNGLIVIPCCNLNYTE
jgi:hypothetical protein